LIEPAAIDWMRDMMARAEAVTITERIVACRDATDDKFLELAVNGKADLIVSGDTDLLVLNPFRGIPVVQAAAFVQGSARTP
jgi:predicted nucleic acid-binding protein